MTKYIEAARAATIIAEKRGIPIADLVDTFAEIPAADVVKVVRCKDCKYYAAMVTDTVSGDMETATWGTCRQPWFNSYEYDVDEDGFLFVQGRATDFIHIAPNNNIFCFDKCISRFFKI